MQEPREFIIPEDMLKQLIAYLHERPFKEVAGAIQALSTLQEVGGGMAKPDVEPKPEKK